VLAVEIELEEIIPDITNNCVC